MQFPNLLEKQAYLQHFVEEHLIDGYGLVYSSLYDKTLKPWTPEDIKPSDDFIKIKYQICDILNYENAGMTTGAYLAAQSYRYLTEGETDSLRLARRSFAAICHIYEIGKRKEEGYFPKTYGGVYSEEASTDQYLYSMKGMMAYLRIAPQDDAALIKRMIPKMADFWIKRKYRRTYFGIKDMLWPLGRFPSLLLMAYSLSGRQVYMDEFNWLNEEKKVYLHPAESQIFWRTNADGDLQFNDYEKRKGGKFLIRGIGECAAMDIMELDECLRQSDTYTSYWLQSMKQMWSEGKLELVENGLSRAMFLYDPRTKRVSAPDPEYMSENSELDWSFIRWAGNFLSSRSTILARAGVNVAKWLPEEQANKTVIKILTDISLGNMKQYIDPDGKQLLDQHRYQCHEVCSDSIVNWLWAYWQGRYERLF